MLEGEEDPAAARQGVWRQVRESIAPLAFELERDYYDDSHYEGQRRRLRPYFVAVADTGATGVWRSTEAVEVRPTVLSKRRWTSAAGAVAATTAATGVVPGAGWCV